MRRLTIALVLLAGAASAASATLIDNFSTAQGPLTGTGGATGGGLLGGERDVFVHPHLRFTANGAGRVDFNPDAAPPFTGTPNVILYYDGLDGGDPFTTGNLAADLSAGSPDRFLLDILASSPGSSFLLSMAVNYGIPFDGTVTGNFIAIPADFGGTIEIPLSAFQKPIDMTYVRAIQLQFLAFGGAGEAKWVEFDNFRLGTAPGATIPEPGTGLLFAGGWAALALARRRRHAAR